MTQAWITNIFKDGYNFTFFNEITEEITLHSEINKTGEIRCDLCQDTIKRNFNVRAI